MARLIEERPEDVEEKDIENRVAQEPQVEEETLEEPETDLPDKYQGKSTAEIVRMHQEAEKLLGKQSSEVGELRKVVDDYIQTQLSTQETQATQADEEIDFFSDPDKAVERAINNHPKIKEAEQISNQYRQSTAMNKLQTKHPEIRRFCRMRSSLSGLRVQRLDNSSLYRQTNSMIMMPLTSYFPYGRNVNRLSLKL